jgi:hypothetical protein
MLARRGDIAHMIMVRITDRRLSGLHKVQPCIVQ